MQLQNMSCFLECFARPNIAERSKRLIVVYWIKVSSVCCLRYFLCLLTWLHCRYLGIQSLPGSDSGWVTWEFNFRCSLTFITSSGMDVNSYFANVNKKKIVDNHHWFRYSLNLIILFLISHFLFSHISLSHSPFSIHSFQPNMTRCRCVCEFCSTSTSDFAGTSAILPACHQYCRPPYRRCYLPSPPPPPPTYFPIITLLVAVCYLLVV